MTILDNNTIEIGSLKYRIFDKVPLGYEIWNIGGNMGSDKHIPFCRTHNEYLEEVDTDSLIAVRLPENEVKTLRAAASFGITHIEKAEKYVRKCKRCRKRDSCTLKSKNIASQALSIFKRLYY